MGGTVFQTNFTGYDWAIVLAYLLVSVAVGVYANRYISSMTDYVVAGRSLKTYLALATLTGTELGLVTVMYSAQKGFTGGFAAFHIAVAAGIVTLLVGVTGFIIVPLRRMGVMTIPEFYERRFGRKTRVLGGAVLAFSGILNMGMFLKAGSMFVLGVTGLTEEFHLKVVMSVLLGLVLLYTILGGMVSVVITDYIQFVVLSFSMLACSAIVAVKLGWWNIVNTVVEQKGIAGFDPFHEQGFGPSYVIWMFFLGLVGCAVWQSSVLRACSAESTKVVKKVYSWASVSFLIRFLIPYFWGIAAFAFIAKDEGLRQIFMPDAGKAAASSLMAMPVFFAKILPAGLIGVVTAGMLAAFMSTHDSYLLCWSSVITQDVVAPISGRDLSSRTRILITRITIFMIGVFLLVWGLWYPLGQDLWDYMAITGAIYFTGAFALLVAGIYWKRASSAGAVAAILTGFLSLLGLKPVQDFLGIDVGSEKVGIANVCVAVAAMVLFSYILPDREHAS